MASYKAEAGAILQPGNQISRLSSYNTEGGLWSARRGSL